jgi:cob(I)alamin adenosyltransferase
MRITKVYTRTGDQGETGLGGGQRVTKDALRVETYGTVDELNSVVGLARAHVTDPQIDAHLEAIQHQLFDLGSDLCVLEPDKLKFGMQPFPLEHSAWLETGVLDPANEELSPLKEFVLPAGLPAACHLHVARCVCRRAERLAVRLVREETVSPHVVIYLNRLSDALFVLARLVNKRGGTGDVLWKKTHRRGGAEGAGP